MVVVKDLKLGDTIGFDERSNNSTAGVVVIVDVKNEICEVLSNAGNIVPFDFKNQVREISNNDFVKAIVDRLSGHRRCVIK